MKIKSRKLVLDAYRVLRSKPKSKYNHYFQSFNAVDVYECHQKSYLFNVTNAYVTYYGVIFKNGVLLPSITSQMKSNLKGLFKLYLSCFKKIIFGKVVKLDMECIVVHNNYPFNYYHWLTEIILRLYLIRDELNGKTLLLPSLTQPFQKEILALFSEYHFEIYYIGTDKLIKAKRIYNPSFIADYGNYHPQTTIDFSSWIKEKLILPCVETDKKNSRIYISRKKATYRKLINEDEVISCLTRHNFTIIDLEDLTFKNQVILFHNADVVIAPHGAGLTNIMFCKNGTTVIEIFAEKYIHTCFYTLGDIFNINYHFLVASSITEDKQENWQADIILDVTQLEKICMDLGF